MDDILDKSGDLSKKLEELDDELETLFQSVKEIKEIKDAVTSMPEDLRKNEMEIEHQKKDLEQLILSANNILMTFEEKAKGVFFDLEHKTDTVIDDVRSSLSQLRAFFQSSSAQLKNEQIKNIDKLSEENDRLQYYDEMIEKLERRNEENREYFKELENRIYKREEALKTSLYSKIEKQKSLILFMTIAFMVVVFFLILFFI